MTTTEIDWPACELCGEICSSQLEHLEHNDGRPWLTCSGCFATTTETTPGPPLRTRKGRGFRGVSTDTMQRITGHDAIAFEEFTSTHHGVCLWRVRAGREADVEGWILGKGFAIAQRFPDGSWDLFTSLDTLDIAATLADAEQRLGLDPVFGRRKAVAESAALDEVLGPEGVAALLKLAEGWKVLGRPSPGGHRFFARTVDGEPRIAIADSSGLTPDTTDDGTLYLDTSRALVLATDGAWLPLVSPEGKRSATTITLLDVAFLLRRGLWPAAVEWNGDAATYREIVRLLEPRTTGIRCPDGLPDDCVRDVARMLANRLRAPVYISVNSEDDEDDEDDSEDDAEEVNPEDDEDDAEELRGGQE